MSITGKWTLCVLLNYLINYLQSRAAVQYMHPLTGHKQLAMPYHNQTCPAACEQYTAACDECIQSAQHDSHGALVCMQLVASKGEVEQLRELLQQERAGTQQCMASARALQVKLSAVITARIHFARILLLYLC